MMPKALHRVAIFLCLCGIFGGCSEKPLPAASEGDIVNYFVNASSGARLKLAAMICDSATIASAFRSARGTSAMGMRKEWLNDTAGNSYCLGYLTPAAIAPDTTYPLIIYLHGGIGSPRNDKGDSAFRMLADLADTFKLFLASPSGNRYTPWWSAGGLYRILQTLRFMSLHYPINPDKVFLAGVSDGATGCYAAANTIPAPFAGFIAVSGFGGMLPMVGMPLDPGNLKGRPIYNVNAGHDRIYPIETVTEFVRALQEQGVPVLSKVYPDEFHGFDYRAKEMGTLANFVRSWSRPVQNRISWTFIDGFPNCPGNILECKPAAPEAQLSALWSRDSLVLRWKGIDSVSLYFPAATTSKRMMCTLLSAEGKTRVCTAAKLTWLETLDLMVRDGFPGFRQENVFRIKF
jgi:pimeloyl-ACP methyl ester carboxylesterase